MAVVLVVDDGLANRELVQAYLSGLDCEVRLASDGASALEQIQQEPPDLVLLDVQMPGMDGYEVCRRIKAGPGGRLLPVVMITALNQTDDRVRALESGADDFMAKPVERVELVARVRSALRLKALYNTLDSAEQVIFSLAAAVEAKDSLTEKHTQRVGESARHLGSRLGMPEVALDALYRGGIIHDIGKIGVPDSILLKPGPLDRSSARTSCGRSARLRRCSRSSGTTTSVSTAGATPTVCADARSLASPGSSRSATHLTRSSTTARTARGSRSIELWRCCSTAPAINGIQKLWTSSWARCPPSTGSAPPEHKSVTSVLAALQNLTTVAFVLLGVATAVTWARHRDRPLGWLALAIILLSSVTVLGRLPALLHFTPPLLTEIDLIFFVGSSYALLRFRASLIPLPRVWHIAAVTAMVVALAVFFLARFLGNVAGASTQLQTAATLLILLVWAATVIEPCVRFWLVAGSLPAVQAWRLRSLSLGFAGIVGILVFALLALGVGAASGNQVVKLIVQLVVLAV